MRVLVTGDRGWTAADIILRAIEMLPRDTVVVHGAADGADLLAATIAHARKLSTWAFPADWDQHGRAAGPIRNQRMLDEAKPDFVIAFHNFLPGSKGTRDMVRRAAKAGVPVQLYNDQGKEVPITDEMLAPAAPATR